MSIQRRDVKGRKGIGLAALLLGALGILVPAHAQAPATPEPTVRDATGHDVKVADLPAAVRLGVRAETVRRSWPTLPIVVLVPDGGSYLAALSAWRATTRFPVLIDDGTLLAREDAARFIRAFKPEKVVRWTGSVPLGPSREDKRGAIEHAIMESWGAMLPGERAATPIATMGDAIARWQKLGVVPPGVIVADPDDEAWPAAAALSIGRMEPIVWIAGVRDLNGALDSSAFVSLEQQVRAGAAATGIPYEGVGAGIDAITLCTHTPARTNLGQERIFATTDLLGRSSPGDLPEKGARWAWTGQICGNQTQSAYISMCSLFLGTSDAWLFDGYPNTKPWNEWDMTSAGAELRKAGLTRVIVEDTPRQSAHTWRLSTAFGITAGFVGVTTKGMPEEFDLEPGQCRPGDVPMLGVPAMVYFVHSFSAASPGARNTIAARWLERGAYAYLGSVQEPFLQAFPPTPKVADRLTATYPFAAAVRFDEGPAWRLATFGDPLTCLGPAARIAPDTLREKGVPLDGTRDVSEDLKSALAERDFERAIAALTLLGRDEDVGKLVGALLQDEKSSVAPGAACAAIPSLQRSRRPHEIARLYATLPKDRASDPILRDVLWQSQYPEVSEGSDATIVSVLAANLREDQPGQDAALLAPMMARAMGSDAAISMLKAARDRSKTDFDRTRAEEAIKRVPARPGR
jgi:hypothetical protein